MYFDLVNGEFIENEDGILCGIVGKDESNNDFRAIFFMPQITELQNGNRVSYIYTVQIKAVGTDKYLQIRNEEIVVDNNTYIKQANGKVVDKEEAVTIDEDGTETLNEGYSGQLDFYVDSICKGYYERTVVYENMMESMLENELNKLPKVQFRK